MIFVDFFFYRNSYGVDTGRFMPKDVCLFLVSMARNLAKSLSLMSFSHYWSYFYIFLNLFNVKQLVFPTLIWLVVNFLSEFQTLFGQNTVCQPISFMGLDIQVLNTYAWVFGSLLRKNKMLHCGCSWHVLRVCARCDLQFY